MPHQSKQSWIFKRDLFRIAHPGVLICTLIPSSKTNVSIKRNILLNFIHPWMLSYLPKYHMHICPWTQGRVFQVWGPYTNQMHDFHWFIRGRGKTEPFSLQIFVLFCAWVDVCMHCSPLYFMRNIKCKYAYSRKFDIKWEIGQIKICKLLESKENVTMGLDKKYLTKCLTR